MEVVCSQGITMKLKFRMFLGNQELPNVSGLRDSLSPISYFGQLPAPDVPKEGGTKHGNVYGVIISVP